mgnify:CR=1 FL=1
MSYSIIYKDGAVHYYYETLDELDDAREVYEKAIEEMKHADSIQLVDKAGDTIESHIFLRDYPFGPYIQSLLTSINPKENCNPRNCNQQIKHGASVSRLGKEAGKPLPASVRHHLFQSDRNKLETED